MLGPAIAFIVEGTRASAARVRTLTRRQASGWLIASLLAFEVSSFVVWRGASCRPMAPPLVASLVVAGLAVSAPETRAGRVLGVAVAVCWVLVGFGRDEMELHGMWWWWAPGLGLAPHMLAARVAGVEPDAPLAGALVLFSYAAITLLAARRESALTQLALLVAVVGVEHRVVLYLSCLAETL